MFYDPMIAKLVTWAPTRQEAIEHMQTAIDAYQIRGVESNLPFLSALFAHPALKSGDLTTRFIEDHFPEGFNSRTHEGEALAVLPLVAAWLEWRSRLRDRQVVDAPPVATSSVMAAVGHSQQQLSNDEQDSEQLCVIYEGEQIDVELNKAQNAIILSSIRTLPLCFAICRSRKRRIYPAIYSPRCPDFL